MKVWVTRGNKTEKGTVMIWLTKPDDLGDGQYFSEEQSHCLLIWYRYFEQDFGFLPDPGTCKPYELYLKEVK